MAWRAWSFSKQMPSGRRRSSVVVQMTSAGKIVMTPHLDISWQPGDVSAVVEMGAAWKIITEDMPEPPWIEPGGPRGE